ncbi:MAG: RNA polymerase sigma factor [Actinomycetota bacterium]
MHDADFERLIRNHERAVSTYARSMASTPTIAEDAVQETFLRAWVYLDSFRGSGSFEGWLIRICRRCIFDLQARHQRNCELMKRGCGPTAQAADHTSEVYALVDTLSLEQREVLVLCGILGYDYETASTILDLPIGTVRSRLHRARAALAEALRADAGEDMSA